MSAENRRTAATLGTGIMAAIGRELRLMYNDILAEGVPERFAAILRRLERAEQRRLKKRAAAARRAVARAAVPVCKW